MEVYKEVQEKLKIIVSAANFIIGYLIGDEELAKEQKIKEREKFKVLEFSQKDRG